MPRMVHAIPAATRRGSAPKKAARPRPPTTNVPTPRGPLSNPDLLGSQPVTAPDTQYAKNGDVHIAYRMLGKGPVDLLLMTGLFLPMEALGEDSPAARFLRRLAGFSRVIL